MPKTVILPPGTQTPIAPFSPGTLADGVVYVSGTLAFDKDNNVAHVGDAEGQTGGCGLGRAACRPLPPRAPPPPPHTGP